ncbi:MAG: hypothetical protein QM779_03720 [Propionicimonas sp.]|uniref:hypothetical protein n=1 Tax=Propionicimonas sp. TaxID=1955623 RepID=UPI003D095976
MTDVVRLAVDVLRDAGARCEPGLSDAELARVQARWGLAFCADHAEFLQRALPVGDGWIDWRNDAEATVRERLAMPVAGLLFDVTHNGFWPGSWGTRPDDAAEAEEQAAVRLAAWPVLVPLYGHRYLPPGPYPSPAPVLSVVQSDVIHYGRDLLAWVEREFLGVPLPEQPPTPEIPFWSRLAGGSEVSDL